MSKLITAIDNYKTDLALKLIDMSIDLDLQTENGTSALMMCAWNFNKVVGFKLIDKGANLDLQNNKGETALMMCCAGIGGFRKFTELAIKLIDSGANLDIQDKRGNTAFFHNNAPYLKNPFIEQGIIFLKLINAGANINLQDKFGFANTCTLPNYIYTHDDLNDVTIKNIFPTEKILIKLIDANFNYKFEKITNVTFINNLSPKIKKKFIFYVKKKIQFRMKKLIQLLDLD